MTSPRTRLGGAVLMLLALHQTGCLLTRRAADAATGIENGLWVKSVAYIDGAWVTPEPEPGLVLCGVIGTEPRGGLQTPDYMAEGVAGSADPLGFVAFVPAERLRTGGRALTTADFHERGGAPCTCLDRLPGARPLEVGPRFDLPAVEIVNPGGPAHPEVLLEQQRLRVQAEPGLVEEPVEAPLGPSGVNGGNRAYWVLVPPALVADTALALAAAPVLIVVQVVVMGTWAATGFPEGDPNAPPYDACRDFAWLNARLARD